MLAHRSSLSHFITTVLLTICIVSLLAACQNTTLPVIDTNKPQAKLPDYSRAEITFETSLPAPLHEGENLFLEILDEVTGLALNAARVQMQTEDQQNFAVKLPVVVGSVLKYRYARDKEPAAIEYNSLNHQVRYRMYVVDGPGAVRDTISAWKSTPASRSLGRIFGQVAYVESNAPVVNALVAAGGVHTLTASDGSFIIEGLPPGVHNLVVYSLDGAFRPFQQGAVVAADSTTPAFIQVQPSSLVEITFIVQAPEDNIKGVPIRMVGNTLSLGNTFADLKGGVSVLAARAPMMELRPDGRYSLKIKLPAGSDLRYKYTLGDGFWNAERTGSGGVRVRQLIVPNRATIVRDAIETWRVGGQSPISFSIVAPANTPASDTLSVQFNPFGWTESIPMWPAGSNRWFYVLYDPLNTVSGAAYRYCRNGQCGTADAAETSGGGHPGKSFPSPEAGPTIEESIPAWAWMEGENEPVVVPATEIKARNAEFQAGVALAPGYHPGWQPHLGPAFQTIRDVGANAVIIAPTWRMTHQAPPVIEIVPGQDPLWLDLAQMANLAQKAGLSLTIHPVLQYDQDPAGWWSQAPRDDGWWQSWFDRYRTFLLYHADLAAQTGAKALILGDESILPALPGGTLADGSPSGVPGNAAARWERLIADVRTHYPGKLVWFMPYTGGLPAAPDFVASVDQLYVQIAPPIADSDKVSVAELETALATRIDRDILALQEQTNHPVLLGLLYPSTGGMLDGCAETGDGCLPSAAYKQPGFEFPGSEPAFKEQANAYGAVLSILNQRSWISGFYSAGYYLPASLRDYSTSVRGKPASDILWYWYARLLGRGTP
jgi:hypothetical protein